MEWSYFGLISLDWPLILAAYAGTAIVLAVIGLIAYCLVAMIPAVDRWLEARHVRRSLGRAE